MTAPVTTRTLAGAVGLAASAALLVGVTSSEAATRAHTTVTIKAEQTDLSGTVKSKRKACKDGRKVLLVKQKGAKGGDDDEVIASDTTELEDGVGEWSTGNTGIEGRFYAKVKRTPLCKGAVSDTVRAVRNDD
jgi:uncharacterized cupredoxin-like copper-binding protein